MADHTLQGELKTLAEKAAAALTGIQPGEERTVTLDPGDVYMHLPESDGTIVGVDAVEIKFRRPT